MRPTTRLFATVAGEATKSLRPTQMALLPPILLYRRLFRVHRYHLPREQRLLGDEYIKAEFRAHQKIDNPVHIIGFLTEWQHYAQLIEGGTWRGEKIDKQKIEKMSDQQIGQLYELMQAIRKQDLIDNDPEYDPDK
ncbi:ACN9-domain-containing protein [Mytilinidion resinicola]|uniref:Succinate dehydrogenase assembly factor 3 n=1 Tax=Mytilinidion resinicola TaxID=574789 RepID=A0A6A6Z3X6_9PEZI|nr:ACN9-domain-containing protein [Mytilinidion resinicola]KAF2815439.1 ACN9-domain-containing protein [Mytilinidion resinicola]